MVTFTITEKGYSFDQWSIWLVVSILVFAMGYRTPLLERFKAGKLSVTLQSTDNCSHTTVTT